MLFRQYLDKEPVIATSYLFGCPTEGIGAVVDPMGDIGRYLKESEEGKVPLRYVIDTHMHADHISNGRELAEAAGAEYVLLAGTETNYTFRGVEDGEILHMGNTEVRGAPYAGAYAGAHLLGGDRPCSSRRAVVGADGPHAHGE